MTFSKCQKSIVRKERKKMKNGTRAMKNDIGIIKEIDNLGRMVIPKEYRDRFGFRGEVEVVATPDGVLLRTPEYKLVRVEDSDKGDIK